MAQEISTRRIAGLLGGAILAFVAVHVARDGVRAALTPGYWEARMREPVPPGAIRLVALGDSAVMAIGADHPMDGFVGLTARHIEERTGRPVHITNVSSGVSTAEVVLHQLPRVDLAAADIVIVADDNFDGTSPEHYRADLTALVRALPADRSVYSDLPGLPGEGPYQRVLEEVTDANGIMRADFASVFNGEGRRLDIFSWLPPHLNSRGYAYWFKAFQPKVDLILARMPPAATSQP